MKLNARSWHQTKNLSTQDFCFIAVCIMGLIYFTAREPMLIAILTVSLLCCTLALSFIQKLLGSELRIKPWQLLAIATGITMCFVALEAPSHALLFEALEEAMGDVTAATGDAVDEEILTGLFTFFRIVVILAFVAAAILGLTQALQGSDWRPIANMMGIGVGLVLSIEVITNLIVGGT